MTTQIRLISFATCPYVQRSLIVLAHKNVPHQTDFIDLSDKPAWFLKLNPRGKVPVVVVDGTVVYESAVINELLEELHPAPAMLPADPLARAQQRIWIEWANSAVMPAMVQIYFGKTQDEEQQGREALAVALQKMDEALSTRVGPYFDGSLFGLVDATWAPIFDRFETLRVSWGWTPDPALTHLLAWGARLQAHPAVVATRPQNLVEAYAPYRARQLEKWEA